MTARSFALTFLAMLVALAVALTLACAESPASVRHARCAEDAPCWSWPRMGNHKRGVVIVRTDGGVRHAVVGCARFARLARTGRLDSSTPRLKGDRWCVRRHA